MLRKLVANVNDPQTIEAKQSTSTTFYHSDYRFLGIGLAVMATSLLAVWHILWGWWELDCSITLSPLEVAKAFRAPILQTREEFREDDDILRNTGHAKVRYVDGALINEGF